MAQAGYIKFYTVTLHMGKNGKTEWQEALDNFGKIKKNAKLK